MSDASSRSQRLVLSLHRATALVERVADGYLRSAHGVGISTFAAMVTIEAVGPARQSAIARGLGVSRAAVTHRIAELETLGLADVVADPTDSRANLVTLSSAGERLLSEAWAGLARSEDGLDRDVDVAALQRALDTLIGNAERHLVAQGVHR